MSLFRRARTRVALGAVGALGLALLAAPHAVAATGTPTTPTELFNGYSACSGDVNAPVYEWGSQGVLLEGIPGTTDPSGSAQLTEHFQVWPVADPTQITDLTRDFAGAGYEAGINAPSEILTDGQVYAWQAQTLSGTDASAWSAPCYFAVDDTRPVTPTVTSANYPAGQVDAGGEPVRFTFDANGSDDVAGFEFDWQSPLPVHVVSIGDHGIPQPTDPYEDHRYYVRADSLGGSATVNLVPPYGFGPLTLHVASLDRAMVPSFTNAEYSFTVISGAPTLTPVGTPQFDRPATFDIAADPQLQAKSPAVSYTVSTQGGQHDQTLTVPAASDGTAKVRLTLDGTAFEQVRVSSTSANGWVSEPGGWDAAFDTTPTVTSDVYAENASSGGPGVPGTFTFAPKVPHIVSYTYSFNWGDPVTVKAGAGHTARIHWTPTDSGFNALNVWATTADGIQLTEYDYYFTVN